MRHIVIKLTEIKDKEKILKAMREKEQITYKGTPIRLTADLSEETLQARSPQPISSHISLAQMCHMTFPEPCQAHQASLRGR